MLLQFRVFRLRPDVAHGRYHRVRAVLLLGADPKSAALGSDLKDAVAGELGSLFGVAEGVLVGRDRPGSRLGKRE